MACPEPPSTLFLGMTYAYLHAPLFSLSRQLGTSLASVVLFEEEIRRGQRAAKLAALDRIELSEQLEKRTQEAIESETKFTRMVSIPKGELKSHVVSSSGRECWHSFPEVIVQTTLIALLFAIRPNSHPSAYS